MIWSSRDGERASLQVRIPKLEYLARRTKSIWMPKEYLCRNAGSVKPGSQYPRCKDSTKRTIGEGIKRIGN